MVILALGIAFIWSVVLGIVLWLLSALTFGRRLNPLFVIPAIAIATFGISAIFDISSGLAFIFTSAVLAIINGQFTLFTILAIFAAGAILALILSAIWAFIVATIERTEG